MNFKYPLQLVPVGKDYLWGGDRLNQTYHKNINMSPLAESWECSLHPEGLSAIGNGIFKGKTLKEVLELNPEFVGTHPDKSKPFPILVKLIDAKKDLSVQVHPDDKYALEYENQYGKTEMWYILDAEEGAKITYGFSHNVDIEEFKKNINTERLKDFLYTVNANKGDVFLITAGTIHAIGGGILLAEVQQNSNLTYRVYDYLRKEKNGNLRPLHIEKAMNVLDTFPSKSFDAQQKTIRVYPDYTQQILYGCPYFKVTKIHIKKQFAFNTSPKSFSVILCIENNGEILHNNIKYTIDTMQSYFIPAGTENIIIKGNIKILEIEG